MMPKQIPDASQDPGMKEDARRYAESVYKKMKVTDIEAAIKAAYLMGTKNGFCCGYRIAELEAEREYKKVIYELKKLNDGKEKNG